MALGISEMKLTFLVPKTAGGQFSEVWDLTVSAFHTPGHYTQKPGIVTHVFGEHAQVPGHDF